MVRLTYLHTTSKNIIGVSYLKNTICGKGLINRGIVNIQENTDRVLSLKETLGINIELMTTYLDKLCNVNFICLQPFVLKELNKYLVKFKQDNIDNKKIEALLPDDLNRLLVTKYISLHYFVIKDKIISLTYPSDVNTVKDFLR